MNKLKRGSEALLRKHVNVLKTRGYRGFRLSNEIGKLEDTIEVGARSKTGLMLIAIGNTIEEAYENLIERIDDTLDGKLD